MDDLRRQAMQYVSHKCLTPQEFALRLIQYLALYSDHETTMLALAEAILNIPKQGGDGW